jgi:hypothetical protein
LLRITEKVDPTENFCFSELKRKKLLNYLKIMGPWSIARRKSEAVLALRLSDMLSRRVHLSLPHSHIAPVLSLSCNLTVP